MKILIVNTFYYPNMVGGTEHSVKILAEGLKKNNNEVFVFTVDNVKGKGIKVDVENEIKIYRCDGGKFNTEARLNRKKFIFEKVKNKIVEFNNKYVGNQFLKVLEEINPDIIHVNNLYGISPRILKISKEKNIKIVYTIRDYWILDPSVENKNRKNLLIKLYQSYFRKYTKYVDYVTAPSKFTLDTLLNNKYFGNSEYLVVPNCVNINEIELKKIIDIKNNIDSKIINYIFVGMLEEKKGILNLLKAFENIDNENVKLTICGSGSLEKKIKYYCKKDDRINYLGQLKKEELEKEWIKADVCIVPSVWDEPFGRVVIEANQYGNIVIGSNKGGIKEILDNIKTGIEFQFDDIEDLKKKILFYTKRENMKKYYKNILENIGTYSQQRQILSFEEIYKKLLIK